MDRKTIILIGFCGLMVVSALISAINRTKSDDVEVRRRKDMPTSVFAPRQMPPNPDNPARDFSNAIADAVEKVMPSVVVYQ